MENYPQTLIENANFPNPPSELLDGITSEPELLNLMAELLARAYTEPEVRGILGENLLRVFETV